MANGIIPVQWGKELRPSAVNSLDKINEVIHFINQSDIHEFTFSDSGSGESVQTANSTQLLDLTVYGKSVQDGTPTPDNPVEVQVVEAPIGLQIGETVTPIDLQGHVLASLPNGTRDELDIDAAGVKTIGQRVGVVDLGALNWTRITNGAVYIFDTVIDSMSPTSISGANIICSNYKAVGAAGFSLNDGEITRGTGGKHVYVRNDTYTDAASFKTAVSGVKLYCELATPATIELGTIEPPAIPDGSIIKINASLTPVIDAEWFTEDTLPKMMNSILGLIKSLHPDEFTASMGNTLHSINPISIPELKPISDIQPIGEVETGYEQEDNESEVQ